MVKPIQYVLSLVAFGQAVAAAKAVTSFSEWVDGLLHDPEGDNMTPEEVIAAYKSGKFDAPLPERKGRSLLQKRAFCYEAPDTECLVADAVSCINYVANSGRDACKGIYVQCQIGTAIMTTDGTTTSDCNDVARGGGFILDYCVRAGSDWVEGSEYAYGNGNELVRLRRA
jgi:hypothetical protein